MLSRLQLYTVVAFSLCYSTLAGVKYTDADGNWVKIGARIQLQYHAMNPSSGESTDELIFRRLRPYIQGSGGDNWFSKIQWDMGKGTIDFRDAYFAYTGWDSTTIYLGNYSTPFSRESITSSKTQQLVERSITASHNYGVTDRQAGVHAEGKYGDNLTWSLAVAKAAVDPDNSRVDFDTIISLDRGDDWSEGELVGGRVEYHPLGIMAYDQGDFDGDLKLTIGAAAYTWKNDGDNLDAERTKKDLDTATGVEVSGGLRGGGFSFDVEYGAIDAELVEGGITEGLYKDSNTTITHYSIEGGYMVIPSKLELVAVYDNQDADGYTKNWSRTSVGANFFVNKHAIKYQVAYRMGENVEGEDGNDLDELFVQAQYVF